ncbi:MAG: type transport system permease protein [Mycobacteriales bacterium]|jgi:ABC-2 type transport system permease protein
MAELSAAGRAPAGVIHDIGYQRYTGVRLGRGRVVQALFVHSLRTAYGLGRTAKAKVFPGILVGLGVTIAVVAVAIRTQTGEVEMTYLQFVDTMGIPLLLFLAVIAPELVCRDLRSRVLPLYFSRPLRRSDYALAKLAATVSAAFLLLAGPLLLMALGGLFAQTGGVHGAWHEVTDFLGGLGYAALTAVVLGAFALPLAALTSRRAIAAVVIAVGFTVTTPVVGVLMSLGGPTAQQLSSLANPVSLLSGLEAWLYRDDRVDIGDFGPLYLLVAVALVAVSTAALLTRYRKVAA